MIRATHGELEDLYNLVDHLARSNTLSRGKVEELVNLAASLSAALDEASPG